VDGGGPPPGRRSTLLKRLHLQLKSILRGFSFLWPVGNSWVSLTNSSFHQYFSIIDFYDGTQTEKDFRT
jgi:hypothetical protein